MGVGKTYFITGGAGNLACQLTFPLIARGHRVVLFDIAERPVAATAQDCRYVRGDITDGQQITRAIKQHSPEAIVHFASLLSGQSEQDRAHAWRVNLGGTFELLEAAVAEGVQLVLFPSSVASYGSDPPNPLPEDYPQWPGGLYGVTKVAAERLGVYYHQAHGLDFRCIRLPIVVSRYAPSGAASAYVSRAFIEAVREGRYEFQVRPDSRPSLIYVKDILRAFIALLEAAEENLTQRVYNLHAMAPTARMVSEAIGARVADAKITFDPDPQLTRLVDSWPIEFIDTAARRDWGWQPHFDLNTMADDFIVGLQRDAANASGL